MGSKANVSRGQTLSDICTDLFSLVLYLQESRDSDQPDALHERIVSLFASLEEEARGLSIPDADLQDARYALVALLDETIGWASRLEQEFFKNNVAGEEFFNKLEQIEEAKGRNAVLEVYYICLALGFEGRHFRTPERLQASIEELRQILGQESVGKLSPHAERPQETILRSGGIPRWLPWASAAAGVVVVVLVFVFLRIRIAGWASGVIGRIQGLLQ